MTVQDLIKKLTSYPKNREVFVVFKRDIAPLTFVHSGLVAGEPPVRVTSATYPLPGPMTMCVLVGKDPHGK